MPRTLHLKLTAPAQQEGVSINSFVTAIWDNGAEHFVNLGNENISKGIPEIDVQLLAIQQGLKTLSDLAEEPLAKEALDVSHSVEVSRTLELLRRL